MLQNTYQRTCKPRKLVSCQRTAAAVVEFALAMPLLFLIVFGSIAACNAIFTQQFITEVTYQGAIAAARPDATQAAITAEMNQLLLARGISGANVQMMGTAAQPFDTLKSGDRFEIRISVPSSVNQSGPMIVVANQLTAESFGRKQ